MQGPVYGLQTAETALHPNLRPNFHYDDIFGTVINRFLAQAVAGIPLTVYGKGGQKRGYLNLKDTLQCVDLAVKTPTQPGELRILNQFTEVFTVNELSERVCEAGKAVGLEVAVKAIENPRREKEEHDYRVSNTGLIELGLEPHFMTSDVLAEMLQQLLADKERIDPLKIYPRVRWNGSG
jgi:UDP-sulfoquinovose synthase